MALDTSSIETHSAETRTFEPSPAFVEHSDARLAIRE